MKINNKLAALLILSTMSFATVVKADQIVIPVISKPAVLQEGTQRELSVAQIAELLPWAKDSKVFLADLLDSTQGLSSTDKLDRLVEGMKYVVGESAPKNSELLMRYAINRGLVLNNILTKESSAEEVGSIDAKVRVVVSSIKMAIKYYETDMTTLSKKSPAPFVTFGLDYFNFLTELNKSIFDATAQYSIQRTSLEWLQWDLYRDLNNTSYAAQIVKINNSLKVYPAKVTSDKQAISFIRQMKGITQSLSIDENVRPVRKTTSEVSDTNNSYQDLSVKNNELYALDTSLKINGLSISSSSDINGACKALGYERALPGSTATTYNPSPFVILNADGEVTSGGQNSYIYTKLTCMNKTTQMENDFKLILKPTLRGGSGLPIMTDSNLQGVCNILGYNDAVESSAQTTWSPNSYAVQVGENGVITTGLVNAYTYSSIICKGTNNNFPKPIVRKITTPTIQGQKISTESSIDGVCRAMGLSSGVANAGVNEWIANSNILVIGSKGEILSAATSAYILKSIVCVE